MADDVNDYYGCNIKGRLELIRLLVESRNTEAVRFELWELLKFFPLEPKR